jgi:hypothetical protein
MVAQRHLHGRVAEELGDGAQRGAAHRQPGGERVTMHTEADECGDV